MNRFARCPFAITFRGKNERCLRVRSFHWQPNDYSNFFFLLFSRIHLNRLAGQFSSFAAYSLQSKSNQKKKLFYMGRWTKWMCAICVRINSQPVPPVSGFRSYQSRFHCDLLAKHMFCVWIWCQNVFDNSILTLLVILIIRYRRMVGHNNNNCE